MITILKTKFPKTVWVGSMEKGQWFSVKGTGAGTGKEKIYVVKEVGKEGVQAVELETMKLVGLKLEDQVQFYETVTVVLGHRVTERVGGFGGFGGNGPLLSPCRVGI